MRQLFRTDLLTGFLICKTRLPIGVSYNWPQHCLFFSVCLAPLTHSAIMSDIVYVLCSRILPFMVAFT